MAALEMLHTTTLLHEPSESRRQGTFARSNQVSFLMTSCMANAGSMYEWTSALHCGMGVGGSEGLKKVIARTLSVSPVGVFGIVTTSYGW